jgi:hypothetical protein
MGLKVMEGRFPPTEGQAFPNAASFVGPPDATVSFTGGAVAVRATKSEDAPRRQPTSHRQVPLAVDNDTPSRGLSGVQMARRSSTV